ncbi:RING finger protein 44 [Leucoagaricus sp. SymC.cos]|nr:RING finger protein 44 [Leucoagaricus sp. SymC.cos]
MSANAPQTISELRNIEQLQGKDVGMHVSSPFRPVYQILSARTPQTWQGAGSNSPTYNTDPNELDTDSELRRIQMFLENVSDSYSGPSGGEDNHHSFWHTVTGRYLPTRPDTAASASSASSTTSTTANMSNGTSVTGAGIGARSPAFARRLLNFGDYMNDEDFDDSYENLLSLQDALGEVRPRSTPEAVLRKLQKGKYREWAKEGSEIRCPICLEDYEMEDDVLKSGNCAHWMHKPCLEMWFQKANTCPVCRTDVEPRPLSMRGRHGRGYVPRSDRWRALTAARSATNSGAGGTSAMGSAAGTNQSAGTNGSASPSAGPRGFYSGSNMNDNGGASSSSSRTHGFGDFDDGGNGDIGAGGSFF